MNLQYHYEKAYLQIKGMPCEWQLYLKPKPYALSKMPGKSWKPDSPDFRILSPTGKPDPALETFLSDIPDNFKAIIAPFPSHQWMLLRLLYEGKACVELAQANPVLAYCIANNDEFRTRKEDRISVLGKLCLKKQKELLEWLGFPNTSATVRLFQKILPEACNPSILRMFRAAIKTAEFSKALGHIRHINAGVMALITNKNIVDFVTPRLLLEVSERPEEMISSPAADLMFETCSMFRTIRERHRIRKPVFESIAEVQAIHDNLIPQYNEALAPIVAVPRRRTRRKAKEIPSRFEIPPIPGTDDIIPITSPEELYKEGRDMHHCAGLYVHEIQRGKIYIYSIIKPERATLAIKPSKDGNWVISQLRGVCNQKVKRATRKAVKEWLEHGNEERGKQI